MAEQQVNTKPNTNTVATDYRQFLIDTIEERRKAFLQNYAKVVERPEPDPVHDLRVSIRRLSAIKSLFNTLSKTDHFAAAIDNLKSLMEPLGELRDVQVRIEWIERLCPVPNETEFKLIEAQRGKESGLMAGLGERLKAVPPNRIAEYSATECLISIDRRTRKTASTMGLLCRMELMSLFNRFIKRVLRFRKSGKLADIHRARIAFKYFRYTLEIFLPYYPHFNMNELQSFQTRVGNIHDLDLVGEWLKSLEESADGAEKADLIELEIRALKNRDRRFKKLEESLRDTTLLKKWRREMKKVKGMKKKSPLKEARAEVVSMCERFDPDPPHAAHVTALSLQLFDELAKLGLHNLDDRCRTVLEYGCLLHDIGWVEGQQSHHKTAYKMIEESELPLNKQCKLGVALVARYHRKADPGNQEPFSSLPKKERGHIAKLSAIIRIADVLDRLHDQKVKIREVALKEDCVEIMLPLGSLKNLPPDAIAKKTALFPKAFGMPVVISEAPNI